MKFLAAIILLTGGFLGAWHLIEPGFWQSAETETLPEVQSPAPLPVAVPEPTIEVESEVVSGLVEASAERACFITQTIEVTEAEELNHYTWTDENGVVNYSSTSPGGGNIEVYETQLPVQLDYFQLEVDFREGSSVAFLRSRLSAQTTSIYQILSEWIGTERLRKVEVDLIIFPDRYNYLEYAIGQYGNQALNTEGLYSSLRHEAVTYQHPSEEETFSVARHESVHVIVEGILGRTPDWLNEGLASYFGELSMKGQYQQVDLNADWLRRARNSVNNGYPQRLSDYLFLSDQEWRAEDRLVDRYAISWSLVYFLASSPEGLSSLAFMLQESADDFCGAINSVELLDISYPGGFNALQGDFFNWIQRDRHGIHRY